MPEIFTLGNIITFILGILSGILIAVFIYLSKLKKNINAIITNNNELSIDNNDTTLDNTIKYYNRALKKKKLLGIFPLKNNQDTSKLNQEYLNFESNECLKITDLIKHLFVSAAKKKYPNSDRPILELSINEIHDNAKNTLNKLNGIIKIKSISYIRNLKVKEIIYIYNIYKISKGILNKKGISISIMLFKSVMVLINIFGFAYWIKRASRAFAISSIGDLVITSIFEFTYLEALSIYNINKPN